MASHLSNALTNKDILLESGTNELEVLVFNVAEFNVGINVAKVREVFPCPHITKLAKSHPSVRGVFRLRDRVVPCVSLADHLGITSTSPDAESTMILTDFNQQQTAFLVDRVERIHRLSWEKVMGMPPLEALRQTPVTAVVHCDSRLIVMLDFEMIIDQVTSQALRVGPIENTRNLPREQLRIVMCDDSPTIRLALSTTLRDSGYTCLEIFENGAEAWKWISQRLAETGSAAGVADLIISDIEMPQMDGLHLTKKIKEHAQLRELPVLLYSSIVTPDNVKKGKAVGADMQISKPELYKIVEVADGLIAQARGGELNSGATLPVPAPTPASAPSSPPAQSNSSAPTRLPTGVNPQLWQTFVDELSDHTGELNRQLTSATDGSFTEEASQGLFRTLHTIKSSSMVIPCDPITRATHAIESQLGPIRSTPAKWPHATLSNYVSWLESVANPTADVNEALSSNLMRQLFAQLGETVA